MDKLTDNMVMQTLSDLLPLTVVRYISSIYRHLKPQGDYLEIGKILSLNYFIFIGGGLAVALFFTEVSFPKEISGVGDFLAGFFSPLAFLWLVIGYFMQNKELSMNREELKISRKALEAQTIELANSVEQQKELFNLSKKEFQYIQDKERDNALEKTKELSPIIDFIKIQTRKSGESHKRGGFGSISSRNEIITLEKNQLTIKIKNKGKEVRHSFFSIEEMLLKSKEIAILDSEHPKSYFLNSDQDFPDDFSINFIYTNENNKTISNTYIFTKEDDHYYASETSSHIIID